MVDITLSGFFSAADIEALHAAMRREHARLRCPPHAHLTLVDLTGMKVQSQDAVSRFGTMLDGRAYRSRRLAFIVGTTLARSQLLRALGGRDARHFGDRAAAEAWLLSPDADAAAA